MANTTLRRTVVLGRPGENNEPREWHFLAHLRALARQPEAARQAWEKTPKAKGLVAAREGRLQEAIRLLEHARTETPWRDEEVEANLGELRAIRRLERKLELRPNDAPTLVTLGKAYFAQERGDAALACFQRATRAAPRFAEAYAMSGLELHFRGQAEAAEEAYREALRLQPGHQLASLYLRDLLRGDPPGGGAGEGEPQAGGPDGWPGGEADLPQTEGAATATENVAEAATALTAVTAVSAAG